MQPSAAPTLATPQLNMKQCNNNATIGDSATRTSGSTTKPAFNLQLDESTTRPTSGATPATSGAPTKPAFNLQLNNVLKRPPVAEGLKLNLNDIVRNTVTPRGVKRDKEEDVGTI